MADAIDISDLPAPSAPVADISDLPVPPTSAATGVNGPNTGTPYIFTPDAGASKADMAAYAAGKLKPGDAVTPPSAGQAVGRSVEAAIDVGSHLAGEAYGWAPGGLTYLGTLAATGDPEAAAAVKEATDARIESLYALQTDAGRQADETLSSDAERVLGPVVKPIVSGYNNVASAIGARSPLAGAALRTLVQGAPYAVGGRALAEPAHALADALDNTVAKRTVRAAGGRPTPPPVHDAAGNATSPVPVAPSPVGAPVAATGGYTADELIAEGDRARAARGTPPAAPSDNAVAPSNLSAANRMLDEFNAKNPTPAPVGWAGQMVGPGRVSLSTDPFDPATVHIDTLAGDKNIPGAGTAALKQTTDLADQHGVTLKLDAQPSVGVGETPPRNAAQLQKFYAAHGFKPDPNGTAAASMIRLPKPVEGAVVGAQTPYAVLSAERSNLSPEENAARTTLLARQLRANGLAHEPTQGVYMNGPPEAGFAVQTPDAASRAAVEKMAQQRQQESVLQVDENGNGAFKYMADGRVEPMGVMSAVSPAEAQQAVGYTRTANGNHYVLKPAATAEATPPATVPLEPAKPMSFVKPTDEGSISGPVSSAEQLQRIRTLDQVPGLDEIRQSAYTGDYKSAGTDYQINKLDSDQGRRMAEVISGESNALRGMADNLLTNSGGTAGLEQADRYARGQTIAGAVDNIDDYLEHQKDVMYQLADQRAAGKPIPALNNLQNFIKSNKSSFLNTVEGKQLLEGINTRMQELGFVGKNDTFNPPTVQQAEAFRKYLNDSYTPRTAGLIRNLKNQLDTDVFQNAGADLYAKARGLNAMRSSMLDQNGISKLRSPQDGVESNRAVPLESIPGYVTKMPADQFNHLVDTLRAGGNMEGADHVARSSAAALNEIRAQFVNELKASAQKTAGMWDAKGVNRYLEANNMKLQKVFSPSELQQLKVMNDAGAYLRMDRTYPGAAAQHHNLFQTGILKGVEHGATAAGALLGEIPGAVVGMAASKGAKSLENVFDKRAVEKRIFRLPHAGGSLPAELNTEVRTARPKRESALPESKTIDSAEKTIKAGKGPVHHTGLTTLSQQQQQPAGET